MDNETLYWMGFSLFPGIGPVRFTKLLDKFGTARNAWQATVRDLESSGIGSGKLVREFDYFRVSHDLRSYYNNLFAQKILVIPRFHPKYPHLLTQISDPPIVLYVKGRRGEASINLERTVAVVGTRKITNYGREVTISFTADLVASHVTIISGMAYGVDAVAHQTALDHGGYTVAVLGCGVDVIAPVSNTNLYNTIINSGKGAVISEMPPGYKPAKGLFPARNRIISGMSIGVLVTEGADDSGSLITASYAADQGREVFAVPGPVTSQYSRAPFKLIKSGAHLCENASDILNELGLNDLHNVSKNKFSYKPSNEFEQVIIDFLSENNSSYIDEIAKCLNLTISVVSATLSILEIKGVVKNTGNNIYSLI